MLEPYSPIVALPIIILWPPFLFFHFIFAKVVFTTLTQIRFTSFKKLLGFEPVQARCHIGQ